MADIAEKKDKFSDAINHYAEEQRKQIEQEIKEYKQKELEEAEMQVLTECYQMIQKELAQMRVRISLENSRREMDARRRLLERRTAIMNAVFENAAEKLKAFTTQDGYLAFLQKTAKSFSETFHRSSVVIRLREADRKYEAEIRAALDGDCELQADDSIQIGGLKASNQEMGILADNTLDSLLADQRSWFEMNSGMAVISASEMK